MRTTINTLDCSVNIKDKLSNYGIHHIEQIQNWNMDELKHIQTMTDDESYTLYLSIRKWISGEVSNEEPLEYLCFESVSEKCIHCQTQLTLYRGLYYPQGLKKLAFTSLENQFRYTPYFQPTEKGNSNITFCIKCKKIK